MQFFEGMKKAEVNKIIAYIDSFQRSAACTEKDPEASVYFSKRTFNHFGGFTTVGLSIDDAYFTGYFLSHIVKVLVANFHVELYPPQDSRDVVLAGQRAHYPGSVPNAPWYLSDLSALNLVIGQQCLDE